MDAPYLKREALVDLLQKDGKSQAFIKNSLDTENVSQLVGALTVDCIIEPVLDGWIVINDEFYSVLSLTKNNS